MARVKIAAACAAALALAVGGAPARAQSQDPDTAIRLNLSPPGARSLGLGGAFLGLADDATAAYTNPAGLTNLTLGGSEVAVELRHWQYDNSFLDRGHFGDPSGIGFDTVETLERTESASGLSGLSFLSFAWVLPRGLTVAFYRHELARFQTRFDTRGPYVDVGVEPLVVTVRTLPRRSRTDLEVLNYGVSGAFEFELPPLAGLESALSVGLGVSYFRLDLSTRDNFFNVGEADPTGDPQVDAELNRLPGGFYGPPDFLEDNLLYFQEQTAAEDDFGVNVGWLWKLGRTRRWSLGGVFRQGPDFETRFSITPGPFGPLEGFPGNSASGLLTIPDYFGLGVAFRGAEGRTRLTLDLSRTRYSQRLVDFTLSLERFRDLILSLPADNPIRALFDESTFNSYVAGFRISDSDEIHLGLERVFLVVESLFVGTARFGIWNEPFHELEFVGEDPLTRALLDRPKGDELHYAFGLGLVIKEDYQIDLAVDLSEVTNTVSLAVVKFF